MAEYLSSDLTTSAGATTSMSKNHTGGRNELKFPRKDAKLIVPSQQLIVRTSIINGNEVSYFVVRVINRLHKEVEISLSSFSTLYRDDAEKKKFANFKEFARDAFRLVDDNIFVQTLDPAVDDKGKDILDENGKLVYNESYRVPDHFLLTLTDDPTELYTLQFQATREKGNTRQVLDVENPIKSNIWTVSKLDNENIDELYAQVFKK